MDAVVVRSTGLDDVAGMAAVHVRSWQETYRGIVPDDVLDAPDFVARRERSWYRILTEGLEGTTAIAVGDTPSGIIGIASAGRPRDEDATWPIELFALYVLADFHGSGVGDRLLTRVTGDRPAALWVATRNPRAQAFYRKKGFEPDGATKDEGIPEIRMVRPIATQKPPRHERICP